MEQGSPKQCAHMPPEDGQMGKEEEITEVLCIIIFYIKQKEKEIKPC